jgi:hypothetical protein
VESFDEKPRCLVLFEESCRSEFTKKGYLFELNKFVKWTGNDYEQLLFLEKTELTDKLVDYALHLKKRVSPNSMPIYFSRHLQGNGVWEKGTFSQYLILSMML